MSMTGSTNKTGGFVFSFVLLCVTMISYVFDLAFVLYIFLYSKAYGSRYLVYFNSLIATEIFPQCFLPDSFLTSSITEAIFALSRPISAVGAAKIVSAIPSARPLPFHVQENLCSMLAVCLFLPAGYSHATYLTVSKISSVVLGHFGTSIVSTLATAPMYTFQNTLSRSSILTSALRLSRTGRS